MSYSGTVTLANLKLQTANGMGFIDLSTALAPKPYDTYRLILQDSAGKKAIGSVYYKSTDTPFVNMTYAASGSSGITVADNDNIDFGTNNYSIVLRLALPDWTPSAETTIMQKYTGGVGPYINIKTTGVISTFIKTVGAKNSTSALSLSDGTNHEIAVVVTRESAVTEGSVVFYVDGIQLGSSVSITAGAPTDQSNATPLYFAGTSAGRTAGTYTRLITFNRALSAAEVLSLYQNGVADADKYGSQTAQTSGTVTTGKKYRINTYVAGDDFTNIGGTNVSGNEFTATGTTPTDWTHGSSLVQIGATLDLEPAGIEAASWQDSSTNNLDGAYPAAGASPYPSGNGVRITSVMGGSTFNWEQIESGFNTADASGYTYTIEPHVGWVRRRGIRRYRDANGIERVIYY